MEQDHEEDHDGNEEEEEEDNEEGGDEDENDEVTLFDLAFREDLQGMLARLKELARHGTMQFESCFTATALKPQRFTGH